MPKCEHGLTSKECYVCASPKHAEQAEKQEPVALVAEGVLVKSELPENYTGYLYTTPQPQREWVGLTDEERREAWLSREAQTPTTFAEDIEAKLRSKNT